jgi:hypothetical protein
MFQGLSAQRQLALFAAGWLLLNFPLLSVFDRETTLFGLPLLPAALFVMWALLIGVLAFLSERDDDDD